MEIAFDICHVPDANLEMALSAKAGLRIDWLTLKERGANAVKRLGLRDRIMQDVYHVFYRRRIVRRL
jgi:hypothetical protein